MKTVFVLIFVMYILSCTKSSTETSITLSWNPSTDNVDGYIVYSGHSPPSATEKIWQGSSSNTKLGIISDLHLKLRQQRVCFRIKAFNNYGESPYSSAVCTKLTLSDFTRDLPVEKQKTPF